MKFDATALAIIALSMVACGRREAPFRHSVEASAGDAGHATATKGQPPPTSSRPEFAVVSDIPDCLTVIGGSTKEDGNLILARIRAKVTRITAHCGCTWKGLLYRSMSGPEGLASKIASGTIFAGDPGEPEVDHLVVLVSERSHPPDKPLTLHVGCAPAP
jgi:hypothetical protein